jgi:hypothetical protein
MFRVGFMRIQFLLVLTVLVILNAGCGTPSRVFTDSTPVQSTPIASTIPFDLDSPEGVARAIANDPIVHATSQRFDAQTLDIPALVWYQNGRLGPQLTDRDHWVVTGRDDAGRRSGIYDFEYVRSQHRLRFSSAGVIFPENPQSNAAFPWLASATAVERLHALRGLAPAAGGAPRMIYFSIDDRWRDPDSPIKWYGGGEAAMDPMWLIQATDGVTYYVGHDLKVYIYADLPIQPTYK